MRAINHSLTGAIIGLTISEPLLAAPLAFLSHYFLDLIPHFDFKHRQGVNILRTRRFKVMLFIDACLCLGLVAILLTIRPIHWLTAIICAFLAAAPDLLSLNKFYRAVKKLPWKPNLYSRFAHKIQWFERPSGAIIEAVWLVSFVFCLSIFLRR